MEHDLELFSPILEISGIEVRNILQNPGNIGKPFLFCNFSYLGNTENLFLPFLTS